MSKLHHLKCWPEPFVALLSGDKTAEFRKDDRDYRVGDTLVLQEWNPKLMLDSQGLAPGYRPGRYTGREIRRIVTHAIYGPAFGIPQGYCMMSLRPLTAEEANR